MSTSVVVLFGGRDKVLSMSCAFGAGSGRPDTTATTVWSIRCIMIQGRSMMIMLMTTLIMAMIDDGAGD